MALTRLQILEEVKDTIGITGNYQDKTLLRHIDDVSGYMESAGVPAAVIASEKSLGAIARGVSDLWNYGSGGGALSPFFYQRVLQLTFTVDADQLTEAELRELYKALKNALETGAFKGEPGDDGITPHIGENRNWFIGEEDTGVKAQGEDGITPHIGENGNWFIGETDTGIPAQGAGGGETPLFLYAPVHTPGTGSVKDLVTQETYNSERIREVAATRSVWLITAWDSYGQEWGVFQCVPTAFFSDAEQFHGHIWNTDTEEYGHGWIPATATVDKDGVVTVEYAELHGYAKSPLHMARFGNLPGNALKLDYTGAQLNAIAMNREISLSIIMDGEINGAGFFTAVKPVFENIPNATFLGRYHRDPMGENEWVDAYCTVGEDGIPVVTDIVSPYIRQLAESIGTQVQDALTEAKESGEFKGDKGDPGEPGQPGEPGDDYVLTEADKTEIAQEAAGLIDTALLSIIGEVTE